MPGPRELALAALRRYDLPPANVIVAPGRGLVPLDFQDTVWGSEVQDLSVTVAALRRRPDGSRLEAAFRSGYGQCRPWPDVSPLVFEALVIARGLHQLNLTLNLTLNRDGWDGWDGLDGYLAGHAARVRAWLAGAPSGTVPA